MTGGEVDAAGRTATQNFKRYDRRGNIPFTHIGFDIGPGQDSGRCFHKTLPHETGIATDHNPFALLTGHFDVIGDGLNDGFDIVVSKILTQDSTPS